MPIDVCNQRYWLQALQLTWWRMSSRVAVFFSFVSHLLNRFQLRHLGICGRRQRFVVAGHPFCLEVTDRWRKRDLLGKLPPAPGQETGRKGITTRPQLVSIQQGDCISVCAFIFANL